MPKMDKERKTLAMLFGFGLLISFTYVFRIGGENSGYLTEALTIIAPLIAISFGYLAIRYFGLESTVGKSAFLVSLTMAFWFIGDVIFWFIADEAVVSLADLFWLPAYFFFIAGVYFGAKAIDEGFYKGPKFILFGAGLLTFLGAIYFYLNPASWNGEVGTLENIATVGYVIADFFLLFALMLAIFIAFSVREGVYKNAWILIALGALMTFSGDLHYALFYETFKEGSFIDAIWLFGYVFYAAGLFSLRHDSERIIDDAGRKLSERRKGKKKRR